MANSENQAVAENPSQKKRQQLRLTVSQPVYARWHAQSRAVELILNLASAGLMPSDIQMLRSQLQDARRIYASDRKTGDHQKRVNAMLSKWLK